MKVGLTLVRLRAWCLAALPIRSAEAKPNAAYFLAAATAEK